LGKGPFEGAFGVLVILFQDGLGRNEPDSSARFRIVMVIEHNVGEPSPMVFMGMTGEDALDSIQSLVTQGRENLGAAFKEIAMTVDSDQISAALPYKRKSGGITDHI